MMSVFSARLSPVLSRVRARLARRGAGRALARCEEGAATVEFVVWVPFFVMMLAAVADTSMVLATRANMWQVANDTARSLARHQLDADTAEDYVRKHLLLGSPANYAITITEGDDVVVELSMPAAVASIFGVYSALMTADLTARVVKRSEPTVESLTAAPSAKGGSS